jgi:GTP-binding protein HflX
MASKKPVSTTKRFTKVLLLGIYAPYNKDLSQEDYFEEFLNLVKTLGIEYDETMFIKLRHIDKSNFLTKGKLLDLLTLCQEKGIEEIVFSEILTPLQERNLEDFLGCTVYDRERLILEIFQNAAHTAEGKIQVEMAQLEYEKTRIAGKGIQLAQQAGHIGTRGPGETIKESARRHLSERLRTAKKKLVALQKSRTVQRKKRLESKLPLICLVGYTNAGKSSIINALTKSDVIAKDELFATLDTTTRELFIDHKKIGLISDTVGFISQLPHHLIEAFKSTLDELKYADLLLHVVDASNHSWPGQIEIVLDTLYELGVSDKPMLYVFNKKDLLSQEELEIIESEIEEYQPNALISATTKSGLEELQLRLKSRKSS